MLSMIIMYTYERQTRQIHRQAGRQAETDRQTDKHMMMIMMTDDVVDDNNLLHSNGWSEFVANGLAVRHIKLVSGPLRFGSPFSSTNAVICGHCLVTSPFSVIRPDNTVLVDWA